MSPRLRRHALSADADGNSAAFAGNDGVVLARAFDELIDSPAAAGLALTKADYTELFHATIADQTVRRPETRDVRVRVYGPLEARLQSVDRLVLGGLNEGTWPPETRSDPWLSRPMRAALGLDPPERRIGLSAHDFAQSLGAPEIVLTRAAKLGGAPTVTARFVQRIAALAGEDRWQQVLERGHRYVEWARALDTPTEEPQPAKRPEPRPPLEARPSRLSVTAIEDWLRDPYTVYAKYVLRLYPLDAVDTPPGARDRGTVIHGAIGDYTANFAAGIPADPNKELLALGDKRFGDLIDFPEARAFWWPRFERIARWFAQWDRERRNDIATLHAEIKGELKFPIGKREFTLSAIADRIEWRKDGSYAIIDYKTGAARTEKQVRTGLAPQLTLEGAILRAGKFTGLRPGSISEITYVTLKGGEPPGKQETIKFKDGTPDFHADHALAELKKLAAQIRGREAALSVAGASDVEQPLRRLRSPRARQGMVAQRRRRYGGRRMSAPRIIPPDVSGVQIEAADPDTSAFVSANAGSGKTHVLAQRVINLLLRGVDPAKILCITFTKAASANMANRVFGTLAAWSTLPDDKLDEKIALSTGKPSGAAQRARARRLFASALETPGGLKVQTIHAFCTRLLHQFPFEANVAARFTVLDEAETKQTLDRLTLDVLQEASAAPQSALGKALATAIVVAADQTFKDVIGDAIRKRDAIDAWIARAGSVDAAIDELSRRVGLDPADSADQVALDYFAQSLIPQKQWPALIEILEGGSKTDQGHADTLAAVEKMTGRERIETYLDIFCTKDTQRRAKASSPRRSPPIIRIGWIAWRTSRPASAPCSPENARWPRATAPAR